MSWAIMTIMTVALQLAPQGKPSKPPEPKVIEKTAPKAPWIARRRWGANANPNGMGLIDLGRWPAEPRSPAQIQPERFAEVLREHCGWMPKHRPSLYAELILKWSAHFGVDPMTLAALMVEESQCRPKTETDYGIGLAQIHERMHGGYLKKRKYRYHILEGDSWVEMLLPLKEHLFYKGTLLRAQSNIYFAAALLRIFKEQCPMIDGAFGSLEHRHHVSHFIWGDRVRGVDGEDRILTTRRRLIQTYSRRLGEPLGDFMGLPIQSPLDGAPRKLTSGMGEERADGKRRHKGVDFAGPRGEPVRAIADGVIRFAGVDLREGPGQALLPAEGPEFPRKQMGPGGLFILIGHGEGRVSAYMHLDDFSVVAGQKVKRGDLLGHVGRTGIRQSAAHLHFELRYKGEHVDPIPHLGALVFGPRETYRGAKLAWEASRKRRRRR